MKSLPLSTTDIADSQNKRHRQLWFFFTFPEITPGPLKENLCGLLRQDGYRLNEPTVTRARQNTNRGQQQQT